MIQNLRECNCSVEQYSAAGLVTLKLKVVEGMYFDARTKECNSENIVCKRWHYRKETPPYHKKHFNTYMGYCKLAKLLW